MVFAIVLAAGSGSRVGGDVPKQYMDLCGKPVVCYCLETFLRSPLVDKVILVTGQDYVDFGRELSVKYFDGAVAVCAGGADRNTSLMNALGFIEKVFSLGDDAIVLTHDAARPFVSEKMIADNVAAMDEADACDTCVPSVDTVIEAADGFATAMPARSQVYCCQTPQTFRAKKLRALYEALDEAQKKTLTDAGKIFFLHGERVKIVEGSPDNIKITYAKDFDIAKAILGK